MPPKTKTKTKTNKEEKRKTRKTTTKTTKVPKVTKMKQFRPKNDIIVHLPLDQKDIESVNKKNGLFSYNSKINENPKTLDEFEPSKYYSIQDEKINVSVYDKTREIGKEVMENMKNPNTNENYQTHLMKDYKELNKELRRPSETDIFCLWDCHPFKGHPYGIPYDYKDGKYYVYGNFSSPNCAAAYLFKENLSNTEKYRRYEMLHEYYHKITGTCNTGERIELAPDKIILKTFGGELTIEQYRESFTNKTKKIRVLHTPVISITPILEVENKNQIFTNHNQAFIPLEQNKMKNTKEDLVLKRSRPLKNNTNCLEKAMKLTRRTKRKL